MPKRSCQVLPSREKLYVLNLIRKEKELCAEVAKICDKKSLREIVKKKKEMRASFAVIPQTAKVTATVRS